MNRRSGMICQVLMFAATLPVTASGQPSGAAARPEVLVLGVYHMANPGRDIFNMQADDVLSEKRQAEMAQLITVLRKFNPTNIAVERDISDSRMAAAYADYIGGKHQLTRNEVDQIGFRLGKALGHKAIYAVDVPGEFPFRHLVNYAKASGRSKELDVLMSEVGAVVKAQNDYLATHTVLETLLYMNTDEKVAQDVGFYYRQAAIGEHWDWAGADLVSEWFRRNMRIYTNIMQLIATPNERVLVVYGAGHLGWLQTAFAGNPNVRLRKLAEFTR